MKPILASAALALAVLSTVGTVAAEQRVTLRVENMYCASCPFIVKRSLARVPGVTSVEVSYDREAAVAVAVVDYDEDEADVTTLTATTAGLGFPATVNRQVP